MPSFNQAAAALRALVAPFTAGCVSNEEFERRLAEIDDAIADLGRQLGDVRSRVCEFTLEGAEDELAQAVRKWEGSQ